MSSKQSLGETQANQGEVGLPSSGYLIGFTLLWAALSFFPIIDWALPVFGDFPTPVTGQYSTPKFKFAVFALIFVLPLVLAGASFFLFISYQKKRVQSTYALIVSIAGPALLILTASLVIGSFEKLERIGVYSFLAAVAGCAVTILLPVRIARWVEQIVKPLSKVLWALAPWLFIIASLSKVSRSFLNGPTSRWTDGLIFAVVGTAAIWLGQWALNTRHKVTRRVSLGALLACAAGAAAYMILGMLQPQMMCAPSPMPQTYSAHIGPAAAVLAGGMPLVDVQSQYGVLSYLVYAAALKFIFSPSYYAAFAVTSLMNILGFLIVIAIAWKLARNHLAVFIIATAAMVVMPWLINPVPAHGGPRFLPPLLLLLGLSSLRSGETVNWKVLGAIVLCSWWSLEVFLWTMATYGVFLAAFCVERRGGIGHAAKSLGKVFFAVAATHLLYSAVTLLFFGTWPRYDHYLSYISGNLGESWAYVEPELSNPVWMIPIGICLVAIAYGAYQAFIRSDDPSSRMILCSGILCVTEMSYWVGRPYLELLWSAVVPGILALILLVDKLYAPDAKLIDGNKLAVLGVRGACAILLMFLLNYAFIQRDATGIRFNLGYTMSNYAKALQQQPISPCIGLRAYDAVLLVRKYEPARREALFFLPGAEDISIALFSGHRHRLRISNPLGLEYSSVLTGDAMRRIDDDLKPGEIFVTSAKLLDLTNMDPARMRSQKIPDNTLYTVHFAKAILNRFQGCELERTSTGVVALQLVEKDKEHSCKGIGSPFQYELVWFTD